MFLLICVGWIHFWFTLILDLLFWRVILTDDQHWNLFRSACSYSPRDSRRCNMLQHADVCSPLLSTLYTIHTYIYTQHPAARLLSFHNQNISHLTSWSPSNWDHVAPWKSLEFRLPVWNYQQMRVVGSRYLMIYLANTSSQWSNWDPVFPCIRVLHGFMKIS